MKKIIRMVAGLCALATFGVQAGIAFGSRSAAIEAANGTFDFVADNVALSKGTLRVTGSGSIATDASEYLNCTQMRVETKETTTTKSMTLDGKLYLADATMTLSDNQKLLVNGGQVAETVNVNAAAASPAFIQGHGSLAAAINVDATAADVCLIARWSGELNQDITLTTAANAATLSLEGDLAFTRGKAVQATSNDNTGTINFNGYNMTVGGPVESPVTFGAYDQTWDRPKLVLNGDTTITGAITTTDTSVSGDLVSIQGNNHKLKFVGGLSSGSLDGIISNAHITDYGNGPFNSGVSGDWRFRNTILEEGNKKIRIINGLMGASSDNIFNGTVNFGSEAPQLELLTDLSVNGIWYLASGGDIDGRGHTLKFSATSGRYLRYHQQLNLNNITFKNVYGHSFYTVHNIRCSNVTWHDGGGAGTVRINPHSFDGYLSYGLLDLKSNTFDTAGLLFGEDVTWRYNAHLELLSSATLSSTWTFDSISGSVFMIEGNGNVFNLSGGVLDFEEDFYLSNIILGDVAATSFASTSGKHLCLTNVTWIDDASEGAIKVVSTTDTNGTIAPARVQLNGTNSGNLFSTAVTWVNGAHIELIKDVTLGDVWTFSEDTTIVGNGRVIDLNGIAGALTIATGKTLTLSDVVIRNWGATGDIVFGSNNATLKLSKVTIIMNGNVTLGANEKLNFTGDGYFVTGNYVFDASAANANNSAVTTLWFDTVGTSGSRPNIRFGDSSGITVGIKPLSNWSDIMFGDDGASAPVTHVGESMWLEYDIDVIGGVPYDALGRQITLANDSAVTIRGNGNTWYLGKAPISSDTVKIATDLITVTGSASNLIELHDLTISGWDEQHITDTNSLIRYCQGSVIRLKEDQTLTTAINVATDTSGEVVTIDLGGYDLDMSSDNASINIADIDATLTIKNGRIINLKDGSGDEKKLTSAGATSTLILQDVDLVLAGDTTLMDTNITFKGDCSITGTGKGYELKCYYNPMTIAAGASLRVAPGITLGLYGNGVKVDSSITFGSRNATLFIDGGTLDVSNLDASPTFIHGTMRIDQGATFTGDMTLGSATAGLALGIDLMPAASMIITSGTVNYANAS